MAIEFTEHKSVLFEEVLQALDTEASREQRLVFLDCTLGGGGHTAGLLERFQNSAVVAVDRDMSAIERARVRLRGLSSRLFFIHGNFGDIERLIAEHAESICEQFGIKERITKDLRMFNGVLADLGLSSDQLNDRSRGFSFQESAELDMRMDQTAGLTAAAVLNDFSVHQLMKVFGKGGVGAKSKALAQEVVRSRPLRTTKDFADVCASVMRSVKRNSLSHPATVPFQAVRMEVNGEIEAVESLLEGVKPHVLPGGRLAIICFHSLEDRVVTKTMRVWSRGDRGPNRLPLTEPDSLPVGKLGNLVTSKAVTPAAAEVLSNVRSRSARLRVFEFSKI